MKTTIKVDLPEELAVQVRRRVEAGEYDSDGAVLREALRAMLERDDAREKLRSDLDAAARQLAEGLGIGLDEAFERAEAALLRK
jgi:putative addiction module CopG family antidote